MTRNDLFWLAQRFLMLWLCYVAVTHLWQDVGKGSVVVPVLAAIALYFSSSRTPGSEKSGQVQFAMTREDLLWVGCKLFGVYMLATSIQTLATWVGLTFSSPRPRSSEFIFLPVAIVMGLIGYVLLFRNWVWQLACDNHEG